MNQVLCCQCHTMALLAIIISILPLLVTGLVCRICVRRNSILQERHPDYPECPVQDTVTCDSDITNCVIYYASGSLLFLGCEEIILPCDEITNYYQTCCQGDRCNFYSQLTTSAAGQG